VAKSPDAYVVGLGADAERGTAVIAESLRDQGLDVVSHCGGGDLKRQLRHADRSGAANALIIGKDELASGQVTVKSLRDARPQISVPRAEVGQILRERLESAPD
jgi:histidyl-tRNA synthetase